MQAVQKALSNIAVELMRENIESIAICCGTSDGKALSIYDMKKGASAFELVGMMKVLTDRVTLGTTHIPEIGIDDEDD